MKITFATINTWKCDGNYNKRLELLGSRLDGYSVDLICCQEVFSSEEISTEKYLKDKLGLQSFYFPSRKKERSVKDNNVMSFSGLCIFTNLLVTKEEQIYLPTHVNDGERTAQLLTITKEDKKIMVVNTHLTHLKNKSDLRAIQINEIIKHINFDGYDVVFICGDLNATPDSEVIETLTKKHSFSAVLKNYPPTRGEKCIDYIFYRAKTAISVKEATLILNQPSKDGIFPSDHFGILATLKF